MTYRYSLVASCLQTYCEQASTIIMFNKHTLQTLPLVLLSLYMGIWLDNTQRSKVVPRILLVKLIALILTLSFSSLILLFNVTIG